MCVIPTAVWHAALILDVGCMESIVHYKQLLLRKHASNLPPEERAVVKQQCLDLLRQLEGIDPMRRQRYADLGGSSTAPGMQPPQ